MPFTLAHPAAVLPLRRYCPRFLSFTALVIGSVVPDLGYFSGRLHLEELSHTFRGSFIFSLPVGLVLIGLFYWLGLPVIRILPRPWRPVFLPIFLRPSGSFFVIVISLLIGTWSHLFLDSFTHKDGWLVEHFVALQTPLMPIGHHTLKVYHLLWYVCSFIGVAWLCFAYARWRQAVVGSPHSTFVQLRNAVLLAIFIMPLAVLHHLFRGPVGLGLIALLSIIIVVAVGLILGKTPTRAA
jgi:hypothetical protein